MPRGLLFEDVNDNELDARPRQGMAMRDGIAVFSLSPLRVFERSGTSLARSADSQREWRRRGRRTASESVEISNGRI
jgi:hypothetical protein